MLRCSHTLNSLYIENDGFIYPCFNTSSKLGKSLITHDGKPVHASDLGQTTILEWDGLREIRGKFSDGKWPTACLKCKLAEDRGFTSPRTQLSYERDDPKLEIIHLRLGNKCNLRCVMCGPNASNQWYDDYVAVTGNESFKTADNEYQLEKSGSRYRLRNDAFNFSESEKLAIVIADHSRDLKELHFHGGEPLLSRSHNKLIDLLIEKDLSSQIELNYHTNATVHDDSLYGKLSQFRSVRMMLSLDGVGKINDAIRWPSKWSEIEHVIDAMRNHGFNLSVNHTLHMLNAEHLPSFLDYMHGIGMPVTVNPVIDPGYMALGGLLDSTQIDRLLSHCDPLHIARAVSIRVADDKLRCNRKAFVNLWNRFSQQQGQDWESLFPIAKQSMSEW